MTGGVFDKSTTTAAAGELVRRMADRSANRILFNCRTLGSGFCTSGETCGQQINRGLYEIE